MKDILGFIITPEEARDTTGNGLFKLLHERLDKIVSHPAVTHIEICTEDTSNIKFMGKG